MTDNDLEPIVLTEDMLSQMPESAERRLKPGAKKRLRIEFREFVRDMKYESMMASPIFRAFAFEFFVGGWGAKTRAIKRREKKDA